MGRALDREIDSELKNGPLENRQCRDILCCLLFIANVLAMLFVFQESYANNNLNRMVAGYDMSKKACGVDYTDYKYVYFPKFTTSAKTWIERRICVKACPTKSDSTVEFMPADGYVTGATQGATAVGDYDIFIQASKGLYGKICMPVVAFAGSATLTSKMDSMDKYTSDLSNAWYILLLSILVAFIIGFVYLCLLRCFAGIIVFATIVAYLLGLAVGGFLCY